MWTPGASWPSSGSTSAPATGSGCRPTARAPSGSSTAWSHCWPGRTSMPPTDSDPTTEPGPTPPTDPRPRELVGIGIGRRTVTGPVVRMADPVPEPKATPSTQTPEFELARARAALAAVAAALRDRAAAAGGEARDVLDAQALMATDPAVD